MKLKPMTAVVLGWIVGTVHAYAQEAWPPSAGADLLLGTKYYASQTDVSDINIRLNIAKYITESRHTFVVTPQGFVIGQEKYPGVLLIEKPAGSLSVFSSQKSEGRVSIKAETEFPLHQDLLFIERLVPDLKVANTDAPDPEKATWVKAYTAWYNLRFEVTEMNGGTPTFAPLTEKAFLSAYDKLGYVEIDSRPRGAKLTVVGYYGWNETRDTGFLPIGDVMIVLSKDGFKTKEAKETVRAKGKNTFTYTLQR